MTVQLNIRQLQVLSKLVSERLPKGSYLPVALWPEVSIGDLFSLRYAIDDALADVLEGERKPLEPLEGVVACSKGK